MKARRGRMAVLTGACLLALAGVTSPATAQTPRLVTTAVFPGVAQAQTASYDLGRFLRDPGLRLDSQPTADTALVTGFDVRLARRSGHVVLIRGKACVRLRLRMTLHPGTEDPLAIATLLISRADITSYVADTGTLAPLGSAAPQTVEVHRYQVVRHARTGVVASGLMLTDWRHTGPAGFVAVTVHATLLRNTETCRALFSIEQSPEMITLSLLGD